MGKERERGNKLYNKRTRAGGGNEERIERKSARAQLQLPSTRTFYLRHLIFQSIKFPGFVHAHALVNDSPRGRRFSTWRGDSDKKRYQVSLSLSLSSRNATWLRLFENKHCRRAMSSSSSLRRHLLRVNACKKLKKKKKSRAVTRSVCKWERAYRFLILTVACESLSFVEIMQMLLQHLLLPFSFKFTREMWR